MCGKRKINELAQMRAQMKLAKKVEYGKQNHYFLLAQYLTKEKLASIDSVRYDDKWWASYCPKELERLVNEGVAKDLKKMEKRAQSSKRAKKNDSDDSDDEDAELVD